MSIRHGDRLIAAADVVEQLRPIGLSVPRESVARELAPLRENPEQALARIKLRLEDGGLTFDHRE